MALLCYVSQTHLQSCDLKMILCPNHHCKALLERRLMEDHMLNTCKWRSVHCGYCNEQYAKNDEEVDTQLNRVYWLSQFQSEK